MARDATTPCPDDQEAQIAERASGEVTRVRAETASGVWLGAVALIGTGALLLLAAPVWGASFIAFGGLCVVAQLRFRRIGERALVIDDEGVSRTTIWGRRYHVPWSEVTGVVKGNQVVVLHLRSARARFRVPPGSSRRERDRGTLVLSWLDISGKDLVGLIQAHLTNADEAGDQ